MMKAVKFVIHPTAITAEKIISPIRSATSTATKALRQPSKYKLKNPEAYPIAI